MKGSFEKSYNYRLTGAQRVVENAFGIVSSVFRVLSKRMLVDPDKGQLIMLSCLYLHNHMRKRPSSMDIYTPTGALDREHDGRTVEGI